jgi:GT2 family glycosyltransferase
LLLPGLAMASVTVVVTWLEDERVLRTLASLDRQQWAPQRVLVADGGSSGPLVQRVSKAAESASVPTEVVRLEGSVAATRDQAWRRCSTDLVAFLDADEVAPPAWLGALVAPLEAGMADFAGGPTRAWSEARSRSEAYLNAFEAWYYPNVVAQDISRLPMGNSIFRRRVFEDIGGFDSRLGMGGEDFDVNVRALQAGFRGIYVPDAWVHHDQSGVDSFRKLMRRKRRYNVGAAMAYLKNGVLGSKLGAASKVTAGFRHPYEWSNLVVQPLALAEAWWRWRRLRR